MVSDYAIARYSNIYCHLLLLSILTLIKYVQTDSQTEKTHSEMSSECNMFRL